MDIWQRFLLLLLDISVSLRVLGEFTLGMLKKCRCGKASWSTFNGPELISCRAFCLDEPGKADPKATKTKEK
jgi:hypothetical protein